MKIRIHRKSLAVVAGAVLLVGGHLGQAAAVDKCRAKIDSKTGSLQVDATGVGAGFGFFMPEIGDEVILGFANQDGCVKNGKAKKCRISNNAEQWHIPPSRCVVGVKDDTSSCFAYLRGCTPGARPMPRTGLSALILDGARRCSSTGLPS